MRQPGLNLSDELHELSFHQHRGNAATPLTLDVSGPPMPGNRIYISLSQSNIDRMARFLDQWRSDR